jgi:DNA (cytosine-5)-methyltransferase 1
MYTRETAFGAIDLFCGVGGLSLGFERAGIPVLAGFDNWERALDIYNANFAHKAAKLDLSDVDAAVAELKKYPSSLIIGGPPCQDFSHAGKRTEKERAELTKCFAGIVVALKPEIFVMENVDRVSKSKVWEEAKKILKSGAYGLTEKILDASFCGCPQIRKRFFCVGLLNKTDNLFLPYIEKNISKKQMTVRDYFGKEIDTDYYYRHPRNYSRRAVFSIDEASPTIRGINRPIPKGYPGHPNDPVAITKGVRPLTTLERSQIQTFPKNFVWDGSKTDIEQMIGNAVPVNLAKFVALAILDYCKNEGVKMNEEYAGFREWLQAAKSLSKDSADDVVSRIKRAKSIMEIDLPLDIDTLLFHFTGKPAFKALTVTVRSQLKRSIKLYKEFNPTTQFVSQASPF